jgi:hypothetical protein
MVGQQMGRYTSTASKKEEEERDSKLLQLAELEDSISRDDATVRFGDPNVSILDFGKGLSYTLDAGRDVAQALLHRGQCCSFPVVRHRHMIKLEGFRTTRLLSRYVLGQMSTCTSGVTSNPCLCNLTSLILESEGPSVGLTALLRSSLVKYLPTTPA